MREILGLEQTGVFAMGESSVRGGLSALDAFGRATDLGWVSYESMGVRDGMGTG